MRSEFTWPGTSTLTATVEQLLDPPTGNEASNPKYGTNATMRDNIQRANLELTQQGIDMDKCLYVIDPHTSAKFWKRPTTHSPCLTKSRGSARFWLSTRRRAFNTTEICRLRGFDPTRLIRSAVKARVSPQQLGAFVGNSVHTRIMGKLINSIAKAAGLLHGGDLNLSTHAS